MLSEVVLCTVISCHPIGHSTAETQEQRKMFPTAYARVFPQIRDSVNTLKAIDMIEFIKADFSSVSSVSEVIVDRNGNDFEVRVFLKEFDRADFRRRVYAKEKDFYREFPAYSFDFLLLDASDHSDNVYEGSTS